jgi:predicted DNA-binding transcriptional regulator AlpA
MTTKTEERPNRHDRRHPDELPDWMTKRQVSEWLQCSQRQVELLTAKGRLPKPIYLGESSPRWRRDELLASLGQTEGGAA